MLDLLVFMTKFFTPSEFIGMVVECFDTLILDLDNTIYDENLFLFDRYRAISALVSGEDSELAQGGYDYLCRKFLTTGRVKLFDGYLERFDQTHSHTVEELLACLRLSPQQLIPFEYFHDLVKTFVGRLCLVTNGNPVQQRNKLSALGIAEVFDGMVMADEVEKKPSARALLPLLSKGQLGRVAYVGDSDVDHDFACACNIPFIRIAFNRHASGLVDQNTILFQSI